MTYSFTLLRIRPDGLASKKDMGSRKIEKCILSKSWLAVSYPACISKNDLARIHKEHPIPKAT
ncbi:hypothetical protein Hanom_Chr11g01051551 [Helianthus anomalus]